jgi:hypothetical protein
MKRLLGLGCLSAVFLGCAASQNQSCDLTSVLAVGPASATPDHSATPPGNQAQFQATVAPYSSNPSCPIPQYILLLQPTWTISDPLDAQISSAAGTNGVATCMNAAANPITVSASYTSNGTTQTKTATLTCK